jgi:ribosomal protein S27AE
MMESESLLEKCPRCGAWPMAAKLQKLPTRPEVRFRCAKCGHEEFGRFRRGDNRRLSQASAPSGRAASRHG